MSFCQVHMHTFSHSEQRWHTFPGARFIFAVCVSINPHLRLSVYLPCSHSRSPQYTIVKHSYCWNRHIWVPKGLIITVTDFSVSLHWFSRWAPHCPAITSAPCMNHAEGLMASNIHTSLKGQQSISERWVFRMNFWEANYGDNRFSFGIKSIDNSI